MAPTRKKSLDERGLQGVLRPEPTGIKKLKTTRTKIPKSTAAVATSVPVRMLANGLVDLTHPPKQILDIAKRNAAASPLLRLPGEIRNTIWKLAVGGNYITPPKGGQTKGGAFVAKPTSNAASVPKSRLKGRETRSSRFPRHQDSAVTASRDDHAHAIREIRTLRRAPTAFHLPEVCRQIYSEAATLAYSTNIFQIDRKDYTWIESLRPVQREAMTSVEPTMYFAIDMYSGGSFDTYQESTMSNLRPWFPNLEKVHLASDVITKLKSLVFVEGRAFFILNPEDRYDVASLVRNKEGYDVEVVQKEEASKE